MPEVDVLVDVMALDDGSFGMFLRATGNVDGRTVAHLGWSILMNSYPMPELPPVTMKTALLDWRKLQLRAISKET